MGYVVFRGHVHGLKNDVVVWVMGCEVFIVNMDWLRVWYGGFGYEVLGV